ncbi:unnamed protein product [Schistosoma mattheei]|uniref:Uncharacterized protein n=1 Tax=Schistosoma mattheei TaxID=31246 RepID=A0A183P578_9TREM|nr:unnamed protein product [Schistosoma mattheei]
MTTTNTGEDDQCSSSRSQYTQREKKDSPIQHSMHQSNPIDEDLEDVNTFTYLGNIIDEHGGSDADVKARIGKERAAYLQLRNT